MFSRLAIVLWCLLLLLLCGFYIRDIFNRKKKVKLSATLSTGKLLFPQAPGPFPWPFIGNLSVLGQYKVPFQGFTELSKQWGAVYSLTLGSTQCVVINSLEVIREVLNQNGKYFGGRPDFIRYHKLFGGDRNNSLALCDWSPLQQKRRNLARRHCSPRDSSPYFQKMSHVGDFEILEFLDKLEKINVAGQELEFKPLLQQTCANMFLQYMCSMRFGYEDKEFALIVNYFDEIFWEINQGYAVDFLPWLSPFYRSHFNKISHWSTTIRKFLLERIINQRETACDLEELEEDFTDALLKALQQDKAISRDTIIYMLEDFLGGHSAIGNLVMITLAYIMKDQSVAKTIQTEVDRVSCQNTNQLICMHNISDMPFTTATIYEVLRHTSSPIVPHVATENVVISDYGIRKGTIIFINNYILNNSSAYWQNPEHFQPERFLQTKSIASVQCTNSNSDCAAIKSDMQLRKNIPHFLPFSIGKRTCIGQNLVRCFSIILIANILLHYNVQSNDVSTLKTIPACLALPAKTFSLILNNRKAQK